MHNNVTIGLQSTILWVTFALVIIALLSLCSGRKEFRWHRKDVATFIALFFVALLPRFLLSPHTLIHENAHGYEYLRTAFTGQGFPFHGSGYYAFYRLVTLVLGQEPLVVFGCNGILNALTAASLLPIGAKLTNNRAIGFVAGLVYALWPPALRIASTESMFPLALLLGSASLWAWLGALTSRDRRQYLLSGLLLALAVQVRPIMALWPFIVAMTTVSQPTWREEAKKTRFWLSAFVFLVMSIGWVLFRIIDVKTNGIHSVVNFSPWDSLALFFSAENLLWNPRWSPIVVMCLASIGLFVSMITMRRLAFVLVTSSTLLCWFALAPSAGAEATQLRLQSPFHLFVAISVGVGSVYIANQLPLRFRNLGIAVLCVAITVSVVFRRDAVREHYNPQIEYNFLEESVPNLPDDCIVIVADRSMANGVITTEFPTWLLGNRPMRRLSDIAVADTLADPRTCAVWYRGLSCYSFSWQEQETLAIPSDKFRPECSSIEETAEMIPIVERTFLSKPYLSYVRPHRETLSLGFYRLQN